MRTAPSVALCAVVCFVCMDTNDYNDSKDCRSLLKANLCMSEPTVVVSFSCHLMDLIDYFVCHVLAHVAASCPGLQMALSHYFAKYTIRDSVALVLSLYAQNCFSTGSFSWCVRVVMCFYCSAFS